jgi:hypothetical protein
MARAVLVAGAVAWALTGVAALAIALAGLTWLEGLLPPLAIDADALRGALVAMGIGLLGVGLVHAAAARVLRRRPWGSSAAILLDAVMSANLLALSAAALTTMITTPSAVFMLGVAAVVALAAAVAYAVAVVELVMERRSGSAT